MCKSRRWVTFLENGISLLWRNEIASSIKVLSSEIIKLSEVPLFFRFKPGVGQIIYSQASFVCCPVNVTSYAGYMHDRPRDGVAEWTLQNT